MHVPTDEQQQTSRCAVTEGFAQWLSGVRGSLAITTYQAGKLALVGWDGRQVTLLLREFPKPMGLAVQQGRLALATRDDVVLLANAPLLAGDFNPEQPGKYDALYLPRTSYHTGDLNIHDLAFGKEGLWLVNTRYGCLSGLSHEFSFLPRWKPPFLSELAPEDRCHLNGLALVDGEPGYVTALGTTNFPGAWREKKATGGVILHVPTSEIVLQGLCMPHSPRWHNNALWFLNSGAGELCRWTPGTAKYDVVCRLPAYLRGLCCVGQFALVGLSKVREKHIFGGLPVQEANPSLLCGVAVIDLARGTEIGRFEFTSGCTELFDVQFLAGVQRPMVLHSQQEAAKQAFPAPQFSYWLRPSNLVADYAPPPAGGVI